MKSTKKIVKPKLATVNGLVTVTSIAVAEHFGKAHRDVLGEVFGMVEYCKENLGRDFHARNYLLPEEPPTDGHAMCRMTSEGFRWWFTLCCRRKSQKQQAMFNAYVEAFEMMERVATVPTVGVAPAVFRFEGMNVRTVDRDGQIWFVLNDVTDVLEFSRGRDAARMLDDDEKGAHIVRTAGGAQELTIINESGLYSLILKSRKESARRFKKWVTAEVLPTIRKTGRYEAPSPSALPATRQANNEVTFLRLYYAFEQNMSAAVMLWVLMQLGATSEWIAPTVREIAEESGGRISKSSVARCGVYLKQLGLIDMKADLPWSRSLYFVFEEAVMKLLQDAGKQLAGLPGIQEDGGSPLLLGMGIKTLH